MEGVVEELDVVGPVVLGELVQPLHVARGSRRRRGSESTRRHGDRIVEPPLARRSAGRSGRCRRAARSRTGPPSRRARRAGGARRASPAGRRSGTRRARRRRGRRRRRAQEKPRRVPVRAAAACSRRRQRPRRRTPSRRGHHVVGVLREGPRVAAGRPRSLARCRVPSSATTWPTGCCMNAFVADDEVAGEPASDEQRHGGEEVPARRAASRRRRGARGSSTRGRKRRALHRQRVADDVAGVAREARPSSCRTGTPSGCRSTTPIAKLIAEDADPEAAPRRSSVPRPPGARAPS